LSSFQAQKSCGKYKLTKFRISVEGFFRENKAKEQKLETKARFCWFSVYSKLLGKEENLDLGFWKLRVNLHFCNFFRRLGDTFAAFISCQAARREGNIFVLIKRRKWASNKPDSL
jgi:hypothetical protein